MTDDEFDRRMVRGYVAMLVIAGLAAIALMMEIAIFCPAMAHDHHRPDLGAWFNSLHNRGGANCCNGSESRPAEAVWDREAGVFRVRLQHEHTGEWAWYDVPDWALVEGVNQAGYAMIWWSPEYSVDGKMVPQWRCFMPGMET